MPDYVALMLQLFVTVQSAVSMYSDRPSFQPEINRAKHTAYLCTKILNINFFWQLIIEVLILSIIPAEMIDSQYLKT